MKTLRIYRHPGCARCARIAQLHHFFDWLNRIDNTTRVPPTGPLRMGEIVVEDLATGGLSREAEAFERICREIPAYFPFRLLLRLPAFRRYVTKEMKGGVPG